MSWQRDLVAERRIERGPAPPDAAPPAQLRRTQDFASIAEAAGSAVFNSFRHPTIAVIVDDLKAAVVISQLEEDALVHMQMATGLYFNTGLTLNDAFLWKSIEQTASTGEFMYIFKADDGWYCSNIMWKSTTMRKNYMVEQGSAMVISFWAPTKRDGSDLDVPEGALHFPWWSSDVLDGLEIKSSFELMTATATGTAMAAAAGTATAGSNGGNVVPADYTQYYGAGSSGSGDGSGYTQYYERESDKGGTGGNWQPRDWCPKGMGGHGGWMPRCGALVDAYESHNVKLLEDTIQSYKDGSHPFRELLRTHGTSHL